MVPLKRHPVHIDNQAAEGIIKNTFFDLNVRFGLDETIEGGLKAPVPPGESIEDQEACKEKSSEGKNGDGEKKLIQTDSGGLEGSNFAIAG